MSSKNTLRTLKDIELFSLDGLIMDKNGVKVVIVRHLKQEAIKWVKEREKRNTIITNKDWDDFFNITEEDLKEDEVGK